MTKLMNILLFVYAAAAGFRVSLIGMLPLNEMMAVVLLPFFFWKDKEIIRRYPDARKVLVCFVLFGGLLVLSDIYNQSVPYDYLRGWANVFMLIVNFVFLLYLFDKSSEYSILFYIAGGLVSGYFGRRFVVLPGQAKYLALYVYPIVEPILLLGLVYLYKANRRLLVAALCIANGLFWMANDARSTGGAWFVAGCILLVLVVVPRQVLFDKRVLAISALSGLVVLYMVYATYIFAVTELDWGGPHGKEQVQRCNNPYNPAELLLQGRGDFVIAFRAFLDRPLLGYGSWGHDKNFTYLPQLSNIAGERFDYRMYAETDWIPTHSVLMGAPVWAGVGAGLIWLYIFIMFIRKFNMCLKYYSGPLLPVIAVNMLVIYWAFFFSPIVQTRSYVPLWMSWLIIFTSDLKHWNNLSPENVRPD